MSKIGIGMIGCGSMGRSLVRRVVDRNQHLQVRALCDPDVRSIRLAKDETNPDAHVYTDYRELVRDDDIDWVMIASWNCFHRDHAVAALRAGKDVFCQKPLATSLVDCKAIHKAWQTSGRMFTLGFTLRYSPHYRKIHRLLAHGAIGDIISMEFNETLGFNHGGYIMGDWRRLRANAGTHLLEKCCHDIDIVNWMVGSRAARVASFGGLNFFRPENEGHVSRLGESPEGRPAYSTWEGAVNLNPFTSDKDIVDNQVAIIEYANGVRATFHANCHAGIPERRMYICGTEGALRADVMTGDIEVQRVGFRTRKKNESTKACGGHGGGDEVLAKELAASMTRGAAPTVGVAEGLEAAVTCFAIDQAMDTGRVVNVAPLWKRAGL